MTKDTDETPSQPPKAHLNQNLVIAIIGAAATLMAAIIPWALDRAAQADASATVFLATATEPLVATSTGTTISASATLEVPTETVTPTEEINIFNTYMAFDFEGKFIETTFRSDQPIYLFFDLNDPQKRNIVKVIVSAVDVSGVLTDAQFYNTTDEYPELNNILLISQGGLFVGKYKVDLYLNNTLDETLEFIVTK